MKVKFKKLKLLPFSLILLIIGSLYYLLSRQPIIASSYLHLEFIHLELIQSSFNYLPSFVHQLAFILLTWLALNRTHMWFSILTWLIINSLFEVGQLFTREEISFLPNLLIQYFHNGTYSHGDMIAIFFATLVAYIIIKQQKKAL